MRYIHKNKYVKIGYYVWDISETGETPDSVIEQLCYHDEDRELIHRRTRCISTRRFLKI